MTNLRRYSWAVGCAMVLLGLAAAPARGGGSGENVLLVVNQNSTDSLTLANYYARLRDVPPNCVLYLDWDGPTSWASYADFREKILAPILKTIDKRKLSAQIDYVVYSCDFPWAIKLHHMIEGQEIPQKLRPFASLTGATYLYRLAVARSPALMNMNTNWYASHQGGKNLNRCVQEGQVRSQAFRSRYHWSPGGVRSQEQGQGSRYLMSCMLGVTAGRGNSVEEIARCLVSAQAADFTRPQGEFLYLQSGDIRSKTRHACFQPVVTQLQAEGATASIRQGKIVPAHPRVSGLTVGSSKPNLLEKSPKLLPGAFCDNLTSFGGDFRKKASQLPISEFIRAGAAGASGTVMEPFALQAKFPLPSIHLHYYRGCSLAEAYYQSVAAPYQAVLVGDPLCQPWARQPTCQASLPEEDVNQAEISILPQLQSDCPGYEVFLDGRLRSMLPRMQTYRLNTQPLSPGYHELRVAAIRGDAIETRGLRKIPLLINRANQAALQLSLSPSDHVSIDDKLSISVTGGQATKRITLLHNSRAIGQLAAEESLEIEAKKLGRGPVRLIAADPLSGERSKPAWVWVQ